MISARLCVLSAAVLGVVLATSCGDDVDDDHSHAGGGAITDAGLVDIGNASSSGSSDAADGDADADADADSPCLLKELRTTCPGQAPLPSQTFKAAITNAASGSILSLDGLNEGTAPCQPALVCTPTDAPTLLFSDSPEAPSQDGVLYADTITANKRYRLYVYHANGGVAERKFPIVLLNQGAQDATLTIHRKGLATPSKAYVAQGKSVLLAWFASSVSAPSALTTLTIPAGQRVLLDAALDALHADKDDLVHAIYDVESNAALKVSFVSVLANADAATTTAGLPLLTRDANHQRGTFANADVLFMFQGDLVKDSGVRHLRFGGNEADATLVGIDAPTGDAQKLLGNYGVLYRIGSTFNSHLRINALPATFHLAVAPRGGSWGGAMLRVSTAGGDTPVSLPTSAEVLGTTTDAITLGSINSAVLNEIDVMTAGGSNLPIDLMVVP